MDETSGLRSVKSTSTLAPILHPIAMDLPPPRLPSTGLSALALALGLILASAAPSLPAADPPAGSARDALPGAAGAAAPATTPAPGSPESVTSEDPAHYVEFILEDDSDCLMREGKHVVVRNTHPSRTVRVWLDRWYRNTGTGDRSRSDLKPGAEPEPLGCSHIGDGNQEWRIVRAVFLD